MSDSLKIIFAGTPEFSVSALAALLKSRHELVAVYTQPDRPSGRGRKLTPGPVKKLALEKGLPVHQPAKLKAEDDLVRLESQHADLMVVAAYGLLLPSRVLEAPRLGCVNIHASLLPRWRGAAPIQRAILAGDTETGITIMQLDEGLDTGPMLHTLACPVDPRETGGSLHDKLAELGARALMEALPGIAAQSIVPAKQAEADACYARKLEKSEARLDWTRSAAALDRQVRAFNPWPVCQTEFGGKIIRIWDARPLPEPALQTPGAVIADGPEGIDVATGDGLLRVLKLQMPGKRVLSAADFLNANDLRGAVFR